MSLLILAFERWALGVFLAEVVIEHEQEHEQEKYKESKTKRRNQMYKKLPPPTPDRREGRLFPPEQS
jgi:hypothetical protein